MIYINLRFVNINIKKIIYLTVTNLKRIHMKRITVLFFFLLSVYFSYGQEITIGTGSIAQEYPLSNYYGYQRSAALYTAAEINQTGFINKLAWDIGKLGDSRPVKIYLKVVDTAALTAADWATLTTGATLVYNGNFTPKGSTGYRTINLDRSFNYQDRTKNVLVLVETNTGGAGIDETEGLLIKASESTNKHLTLRVDNTSASGNLSFVSSRPNIKMMFGPEITCYGIHASITRVESNSVSFSIIPQTTTTSFTYEVRTSGNPGSGATGLAKSETITTRATDPFIVNVTGLNGFTDYVLYVRANCANNQHSLYDEGISFSTAFNEDFEGNTNFTFVNDTNNKWYVGNAVNNGGTKALYISEDGGQNNTYNNVGVQVSHAFMNVAIPEGAEDLEVSFDWRCIGQPGLKDYLRVWLVPATYTPTVRSQITANANRKQIGRSQYYDNAVFLNERTYVHVAPFAGQTMRIVFEWKQDSSDGDNPPAAIDNLKIKSYFCKKVESSTIRISDITSTKGKVTWAASGAELYEVALTEQPSIFLERLPSPLTDNLGRLNPISTSSTTYSFTNLNPGTQYLVWVRAKCGQNNWSAWEGPKILATDMKVTNLPYSEDFEGTTNFEFKKNDSKNKWFIGSAANNGGTKALYISENYGGTNTYDVTGTQVSHVYKDFNVPEGTKEMNVRFDWRCLGQIISSDYFRVWAVPQNFVPTEGIQIDAPDPLTNRILVGKAYYNGQEKFIPNVSVFNATAFAGGVVRLVFEWRQDSSLGNQPAAAIDNLAVEAKVCVAPANFRVVETFGTSVMLTWDRIPRQNKFEIYYSETYAYPSDEIEEGQSIITTQRPYKLEELDPMKDYYIWIRTICSDDSKSTWIPLKVNTGQLPATFPYSENFEGKDEWENNAPKEEGKDTPKKGVNRWIVGSAVNNGGAKSLYITQDEGVTNSYNVTGSLVTHAYRDIRIPRGTGETDISFDWRCMGDGTNIKRDYFKVWLVPRTYVPILGMPITTEVNRMQVGGSFNQEGNFITFTAVDIDISRFQETTMRLVFEWIQDSSGGTQPPAAIDNIKMVKGSCPGVRNLQSEPIAGATPQSSLLTWDVYGLETQWEVFIIGLDDTTVPGVGTQGIIVNEPKYTYIDPDPTNTEDRFYKFFVRPLCDVTNKRQWSKPGVISFIPPPGCAKVEAEIEFSEIEGLEKNEDGDYVICEKGTFNFELGASYYNILQTSKYKVESIDYRPPFPFKGGDAIELTVDDRWSDVIDLGFDFCFYGNSYDKILINTNGTISFSIKDVVPGGRYTPNGGAATGGAAYNAVSPIPSDPGRSNLSHGPNVNAIMGVFQDTDPDIVFGRSPLSRSINYQIIGKAPCRTLVFNVYQLGMFSCGYDRNDIEGSTQTSQIVMYEGTNIIEVYVKNRNADCNSWNGNAIIGIQNADGTQGIAPPGRNTGRWAAQREAWRFTPDGLSTAEFSWEKDGEFFSSERKVSIDVDKTVKYTAKARYEICGEETVLSKDFVFLKEDFVVGKVKDLIDCARKPGEDNIFDLTDAYPGILGDLNIERYDIKFYETEEERDAEINPMNHKIKYNGSKKTIYVRMTNKITECVEFGSFNIGVAKPFEVTTSEDKTVCGSYLFPELAEGEAYYTKPYGEGTKYEGGATFDKIGTHDIFIYKESDKTVYKNVIKNTKTEANDPKEVEIEEETYRCFGQSQFVLEIVAHPVADQIADMVLKCEVYPLPALSEHNKYYTLPNGEGEELPAGTIIYEPKTIYILATYEGKKGAVCVDQSSFTIDFEECPIPKGISPNGDGINDSFDLSEHGVSKIQIFNRNGMEVYSQGLYHSEWKGQDKSGNKLPSGTYFYIIVANGEMKSGWVQLNY